MQVTPLLTHWSYCSLALPRWQDSWGHHWATWDLSAPGGPNVGPTNLAIRVSHWNDRFTITRVYQNRPFRHDCCVVIRMRKVQPMKYAHASHFVVRNTLRPRQNGRYLAHDVFKCIFLNGNVRKLRSKFHWSLFLRTQLTIFQLWFR